jgi:TolB-like protein/DNA-binding winged helix-turn-helix (wHTH) protein/Flp pilus assembly protein TadD
MTDTPFQIAEWRVDPANNQIRLGDKIRRIEPKAMDVLVFLAKNQGQVVSREEVEQAVWAGRFVTPDSMSAAINKLRKALDDDSRHPRYIETVSKRGYRLIAPVAESAAGGDSIVNPESLPPAGDAKRVLPRTPVAALFVLGALVLVVAAIAFWFASPSDGPRLSSRGPLPSVVVLPFDNLSEDSAQEYFSDGITDDLITDLSKIESLRVIARQSSYHYKHRNDFTLEDVGRELSVKYVVEGSVQKSGSRIRINVQLTNVDKGESLWGQRFDTSPSALFATQDEITRQVINAMTVTLPSEEQPFAPADRASSFDAYDTFLQGQRYSAQRSREGYEQGMDAYRQSIATDPKFARAYGAMAVLLTHGYRFQWTNLSLGEARERSLELARKAVRLNKNSSQIYWALGYVHIHRKEYEAAEQAARQSVTISPNYADGYGLLAYISNWRGKAVQAEKYIKKAMDLNPYHTFDYPWNLGLAYYLQGRYEEAIEALSNALDRNPSALYPRLFLTASYVRAGRIDDAQWQVDNIKVSRSSTTIKHLKNVMPFEHRATLDAVLEDLRKAGLAETGG